jgi:hypothetical protein
MSKAHVIANSTKHEPHPHPAPINPGLYDPDANDVHHFKLYQGVDKCLKKPLLAACPDIYLKEIKHPVTR